MTPIDPFERQLPAALTRLAEPRAPDYLTDILGQTARTRQRPAWRSLERWLPMSSLSSPKLLGLAAIAILVIGLLGTSLIAGGPGPSPIPTASPPASSPPSPSPSTSAEAQPVPTAIMGSWAGASRGTGIEDPAVTHMTFDAGETALSVAFWLDRQGFRPLLPSAVTAVAPGELEIRSDAFSGDCQVDDLGSYRWSVSGDGQWLTFELIEDACQDRATILPGAWQRSLAHDNPGGPGIAAAFTPYFTFSLPPDAYTGYGLGQTDTVATETESYTFKLWKDLDGFVDPCDDGPGRIDLEGLDGFLGYLRNDPRFDVTREEEFTIDGRRAVAVEFRVGDAIEPPCWNLDDDPADKTGVLVWAPQADETRWNFAIGSEGALVVTEVDGVSLVFEPLILTGDTFEIDRATLDTIRFLDELPAPPEG